VEVQELLKDVEHAGHLGEN
jgi:hypothetical protein